MYILNNIRDLKWTSLNTLSTLKTLKSSYMVQQKRVDNQFIALRIFRTLNILM